MAKFIPIILPQPGEDLRTWARQLTSQLQSLTVQLQSVLANIEVTEGGGGGTPTPGGTTTPVKTPDDVTILDANGYYIDGLGRVIVDATGFHVYDLVGFQVINGPHVYINTEHLVENAVKTAQLADDAVTYEKFFPDLVPIKVVDTLPNPVGYTGPGVVWLSTDRKLYRHTGAAWTSAVPAVDITGQLTNAQLESIAAAKLTGQIVETQITNEAISTPKLAAGAVSTAKLQAGAVVADTLAANAVTAAKLAANAVEADKIAANAVTASKLAANAVTTEKLDALAVTAGKLAAGSVVAGKLAANAIVANDGVIANAAIANAQIIDLNASKINAGSIAAERMEANIVTALNGKFATLSALASSLGLVQILPGGALLTQGVTNYSSGTGVYIDASQLRIGNPTGARLQWTGSALEIYNSSNQLTIASGNVDWAGITGTGKPQNNATVGAPTGTSVAGVPAETLTGDVATALANANTALTNASNALNGLNDISADNKLTPVEKQQTRLEWDVVYGERTGIRAQADALNITTEKTAYDNAFQALGTYLNAGAAYTIGTTPPFWLTDGQLSVTTNIVGGTFRANWASLYAARQALLNKIAERAIGATLTPGQFNTLQGAFTQAAWDAYISTVKIGAANIGSIALTGTSGFLVQTATTGARMVMDSRSIKVYDSANRLRVQLGDLTA